MGAAGRGYTDIVIALVKAKANINAIDDVRVRCGMPAHLTDSQYHCVFVE